MFLLDTNVISEMRKAGDRRGDPRALAWLASAPETALHVSVITLMELDVGYWLLARRDPPQAARLRTWLDTRVLPEFAHRTLPIDRAVALRCARLHVPHRRPGSDALIAATALVHGMTVVTRNTHDFAGTGVPVLNPWEAPPATAR